MTMDNVPFTREQLQRQGEPYSFQRSRASLHSNFPRVSQPNTNQPNAISRVKGSTQSDYWDNYYKQYLNGRR